MSTTDTLGNSHHSQLDIVRRDIVAVVDDDDAVREAICLMLRSLKIQVASYANAMEFLADQPFIQCGCLILDLRLPGISGLELQRRLNSSGVNVPIIFITGHGHVPVAVEAMRQGAVDFLQKPLQEQVLLERVQHCLARVRERRDVEKYAQTILARIACLTPREREVFNMIIEGQRSKSMADALGIGLKTVEEYRSKVLQKMHVSSSPELMREIASLKALGVRLPDGSTS